MVTALESLGLTRAFDLMVGSSAGAFNCAYFLAGQGPFGTTIYYEDLPRGFRRLRPRSFLTGQVLDMDYVMTDVLTRQKPLDLLRILRSPVPLGIVVSDLEERKAVLAHSFVDEADLLGALRASAAIPVLSGPPVMYRGRLVSDGGLYQPFPYQSAIDMGATHVLVLTTRLSDRRGKPSPLSDWLASLYLRNYPGLAHDVASRHEPYGQELRTVQERTLNFEGPPYICNVSPGHGIVGRLETDRKRLVEAAVAGWQSVYEVFGLEVPRLIEILQPYSESGSPYQG